MNYVNNIDSIIKNLYTGLDKACEEIGVTCLADMQSICPVGTRADDHHKGQLRRSLTFNKVNNSNGIKVKWGSNVDYAPKIEFENKSYLRSVLRSKQNNMVDIITKHLNSL